ncbi:MAG TPA: RNA-processing protein [Thermoplasmatales archaeon]|nr:RNA-processing protein [Thermoplasmata archaeon]RLF62347.1 MAG: RNA-processing protein [Thermoplasmata archaeon]HDM25496.1 RNA-processing protein [Thermoplasmatales archaeon]
MRYIKIPKDRIGALIGHGGETKKHIEERTNVKLDIDSETGEVTINEKEVKEPIDILKAEKVITAIGRGFSPEHAFKLFDDDYDLFLFDIRDYAGRSKAHVRRLKGRIIGRKGKTREILEELTESHISIYGHTVAIIADMLFMEPIKTAVEMLLNGSKHSTVYRYLEEKRRKMKELF